MNVCFVKTKKGRSMNFKVLITGLLVVIGFSGCIGWDKRPGFKRETLHVTKVNNEFCFYVDDFSGIENYNIHGIQTTDHAWEFNVNTIYDKNEKQNKIDLHKSISIKLTSIKGEKNCLRYGTNLGTDGSYQAKNIDLNKSFWIDINAFKDSYFSDESAIIFENTLNFQYDPNTKTITTRIQRK